MDEILEIIPKESKLRFQRHRHHDKRIIANRLRFLREHGFNKDFKPFAEPHRMVKKHPFDCGKTRCILCHGGKILGSRLCQIDFLDFVEYESKHDWVLRNTKRTWNHKSKRHS